MGVMGSLITVYHGVTQLYLVQGTTMPGKPPGYLHPFGPELGIRVFLVDFSEKVREGGGQHL